LSAIQEFKYNCPRLKGNNIGFKSRQILENTKAPVRDFSTAQHDGFNEGWIDFESGEANSRKERTTLESVLRSLVMSNSNS
jgi:hypothetical protein